MDAMELADGIRADLLPHRDGERGAQQQAYMKSRLPFLGLPVPLVRKLAAAQSKGVRDGEVLLAAAEDLFANATHREHWYAAMALLRTRYTRGAQSYPLLEFMIREGQWWDVTDELARHFGAGLDDGGYTTDLMYRWADDENMWIRRVAIICQLGRRDDVDQQLLTFAIENNAEDPDFFIRKAIGWALREVAKTNPDFTREFVATHDLSPLSVREALKHLATQ